MKKAFLLIGFATMFSCIQAQDSTHRNTTQNHKKAMHRNGTTMPADSVNEGKITTNPNGKNGSATMKKRKSTMNSSSKNSTDSTK